MTTGSTADARITAVCRAAGTSSRTRRDLSPSGIDKRPVAAVELQHDGVVGDLVLERRHHGGPSKAAYVYADEDAWWWSERLGAAVPAGRFGENLRTRGIDLREAVIGERWRVGSCALVELAAGRRAACLRRPGACLRALRTQTVVASSRAAASMCGAGPTRRARTIRRSDQRASARP